MQWKRHIINTAPYGGNLYYVTYWDKIYSYIFYKFFAIKKKIGMDFWFFAQQTIYHVYTEMRQSLGDGGLSKSLIPMNEVAGDQTSNTFFAWWVDIPLHQIKMFQLISSVRGV